MSMYHLSVQIIGRSDGRSAVAAAAYRAAAKLYEQETDTIKSYINKEHVVYTDIMLPQNAPIEYLNRENLWNSVHAIEKNSNAQLAREFNMAFPVEFDLSTKKTVLYRFMKMLCDQGMCADGAIHDLAHNPHAHIMATLRAIDEQGNWLPKQRKVNVLDAEGNRIPILDRKGKQKTDKAGRKQWKAEIIKTTNWDEEDTLEQWRKAWADICNDYLDKEHQIDHRSYKDRGIEQTPTVHIGVAAAAMERMGIQTERGDQNRGIRAANAYIASVKAAMTADADRIVEMQAKINAAKTEIAEKYTEQITKPQQTQQRSWEEERSKLAEEGCSLADTLLLQYGPLWAKKRAQEEYDKETKNIRDRITMLEQSIIKETEKYKQKALASRGFFAKLLGSDGMTASIKEDLNEATNYDRFELAKAKETLSYYRKPDAKQYDASWYRTYKNHDDPDAKMCFALQIVQQINAQKDPNYIKLKDLHKRFEPLEKMVQMRGVREYYKDLNKYHEQYKSDQRTR